MIFLVFNYLLFFNPMLYVFSEGFPENVRNKRSDIDLQGCLDNFNVHKDKIIRTQDSQNMGAKYLNEIDLGSREECLHLCCETDNCDVFVFEEKNSGSCYLFHCGPPEDFKCKFTHHVNYSSGVLSVNRHLPDLESQIKLTKHEQDLTKLRNADMDSAVLKPIVHEQKTTSTTTIATSSKEFVPLPKHDAMVTDRKCSRNQFECRSTGECIAIYNACDGIPQCADASDEAPELACPGSVTTAAPMAQLVERADGGLPVPVRYNPNFQPSLSNQPNPNQQEILLQPLTQREPVQLPAVSIPDADFLRPANDPRLVNPRLYEHQLQPYVAQMPQQPPWVPRQANQMAPQIPQYEDKNTRIFNHKENGYQVPDGHEISQAQYPDNVNGRQYNKMGSYYAENSYRQPLQQENWPSGEVAYGQTNPHQDIQYQGQDGKAPTYKSESRPIEPNIINENVNPKHVQEQLAHDLKHSKEHMEHDEPAVKIAKHVHRDRYPDVIAYKIDEAGDLEDGMAKTQRGAVLAVSLGLIITFIMAIMIGCRLKMVRRRIRKGGKLYAHDADYLVNGMYL
ncbi:unnamed protein product [Phaedon cochleariae]|uniref:MANSC domain-containing protein n=1 Tax=Phaedon cochleariae TaxID=80249 RepID=A0A9P0DEC8_PHACE|nr:unnamed protein product [Phaedon cochleariae]